MSKRRTRSLAAAAALVAAACAPAMKHNAVLDNYPSGISGRTSVYYYDVHGRTLAELRADMRKLGPNIDGTSFVGETRSPMRWTWQTESTGAGGCSIRDVSVSVNAQVTLPRWTPPADTEPGLFTEWNRFLNALETHESGHKDISAKAAKAIIARLRGFSAPCSLLGTRANDAARTIVDRAAEEQKVYDATTRHGITQGTAFGAATYVGNATDPLTLLARPRVGTVRGPLPATVERLWAMLPAAFAANDLTINATDSVTHAAGDSMVVHGMIGSTPASEIIDCSAPTNGRNADSVDVSLFVTARVEAGGIPGPGMVTSTALNTVTTTVQAVARPTGGPPSLCRSRGVLERRLVATLRSQLLGATSPRN